LTDKGAGSVDIKLKDGKEITKAELSEKKEGITVEKGDKKITVKAAGVDPAKVTEVSIKVEGKNENGKDKDVTIKVKIAKKKA